MKTLAASDEQFIVLVGRRRILLSDLPQIAHLSEFEEGYTAIIRSEGSAGYSIEVRTSRIDDRSIQLEII